MLELCNHISAYIFCNSSTSKKPFSLPSSCPHLMMMMMIYLKPNFTTKNQGYNRAQLIQSSLKFCPDGCDSPALRGAGVLFGYCFCVVNSEFLLLLIPPNRQEGGGGGGEVLVRAQEQPARGGTKLWRLPRLPDVPSGTQAPPPQFNCRPRHRRRQQQLNLLGSTPPSSLEMGAGSSSAASKGRRDSPSSGTSALTQTSVPSGAHSLRIQDLEAQVRELKARAVPAPAPSPPNVPADAAASPPPQLPPLDDSRMTPALALTAADLRARFTTASSDAQALMRTMRDIRMEWDLLPLMPSQSGMWHSCEMLPFTLHPAAAHHLTASASAQPPFLPSQ